jgi:hypothetical protein
MTTLQAILETGFQEYLKTHSLPLYQWKAARALLRCRTAALGGHTQRCPEGHVEKVWYNSCRHRSCPQCSHQQIQQWLEAKQKQILPCDHFHVIFTLPAELRPLWSWNFPRMADVLFQAVRDTLFLLLDDPRHLGARPGMITALHTWGRSLVLHPHLHCLITGGGLTPEGTWKPVRNGFLLPLAVVRVIFRGKLLSLVEGLIRRGELLLPRGLDATGALALLKQSTRKKWNVRIQERYEHGRGVVTYLARYLRGGPIKNSRLIGHDSDSVTFRYASHRDTPSSGGAPPQRLMTLPMAEFLNRFLSHIPPTGLQVVRGYGLYSRTGQEALAQSREQLGDPPSEDLPQPRAPASAAEAVSTCPVCGRSLVREPLPRQGRSPPELPEVRS